MTTFEQELDAHGRIIYTNKGVSMLPLLRQGKDVMYIEKRTDCRCKKYDAVLFKRSNGQYVLHRITKVLDGGYFIIGDNCVTGEFVLEQQVLGILKSIRRNQKTIQVTDFGYQCYVRIWRPLRMTWLRAKRFYYRAGSFVKRKVFRVK